MNFNKILVYILFCFSCISIRFQFPVRASFIFEEWVVDGVASIVLSLFMGFGRMSIKL